jgi:hypothetical protein
MIPVGFNLCCLELAFRIKKKRYIQSQDVIISGRRMYYVVWPMFRLWNLALVQAGTRSVTELDRSSLTFWDAHSVWDVYIMYYSRSQSFAFWCAVFIRNTRLWYLKRLMGLEGEGMTTAAVFGLWVSSTNVEDNDSWSLRSSVLYCED